MFFPGLRLQNQFDLYYKNARTYEYENTDTIIIIYRRLRQNVDRGLRPPEVYLVFIL